MTLYVQRGTPATRIPPVAHRYGVEQQGGRDLSNIVKNVSPVALDEHERTVAETVRDFIYAHVLDDGKERTPKDWALFFKELNKYGDVIRTALHYAVTQPTEQDGGKTHDSLRRYALLNVLVSSREAVPTLPNNVKEGLHIVYDALDRYVRNTSVHYRTPRQATPTMAYA